MNPVTVSVTGTGTSPVINPDYFQAPFAIGVGTTVNTSGSATWSVQHTFDNVYLNTFQAGTATWFNNSGITSKTQNTDGNYAFPVYGIRLNVLGGTGTVTMTLIQASNVT